MLAAEDIYTFSVLFCLSCSINGFSFHLCSVQCPSTKWFTGEVTDSQYRHLSISYMLNS